MENFKIALLPGDGIGPDVLAAAVKVLKTIEKEGALSFNFNSYLMGGVAIDQLGVPLPDETLDGCKASDAVMLGAVGGPKWDGLKGSQRPEAGLLAIRKGLGLFANVRPAILHKALKNASPLKESIIGDSLDICVIRELTGGIYFGERGYRGIGDSEAYDTMTYSVPEVERVAKVAFETAMKRNRKVTSVDKANVLENSRLWRKVVIEVAKEYPQVELNHLYVDNAAMQMVINPSQFDVILTGNMFGDILSDEASMLTGSIGMLPSASLGEEKPGLYEPIHGSAPDIAGKNLANPLATILSAAMMLRYSLGRSAEADRIEKAVTAVLEKGIRTADIAAKGEKFASTDDMTAEVIAAL